MSQGIGPAGLRAVRDSANSARIRNLDLASLLDSWLIHLKAERKSPETIKSYGDGVKRFLAWHETAGQAITHRSEIRLDRPTVAAFINNLLENGAEPTTARARHLALRRFSMWLAEEEEIPRDELVGSRPPRLDVKVVEPLTDEQCKALLKACQGQGFRDRRDEAIVRLMLETGARAGEVVAIEMGDVDLARGSVVIRRGKGGKGRRLPMGPQTTRSLDRYLRMRRAHPAASRPALWLGEQGRGFRYDALFKTLARRARAAGIPKFYPHMLRHTAASRWLAAGGSEGGLMAVAGWSRRDMLDRYTKHTSEARAADEARKLNLGDL